MNHIDPNFFRRKIDQRVRQGFDRTVHIALDNEVELMEVAKCATASQLFEPETFLRTQPQLALQLFATTGNLTCFLFRFKNIQGIAGLRRTVQSENQHRLRRPCAFDTLIAFVKHRLKTPVVRTGQYDIPLP